MLNQFRQFFYHFPKRRPLQLWDHYLDIYGQYLSKFYNQKPVLAQIGVGEGGDLDMFTNCLGNGCVIFGLDLNPEAMKFNKDNVKISNSEDLGSLPLKLDIVIDKADYQTSSLPNRFLELYRRLSPGGVYILVNTETGNSQFPIADLVNQLNAYHIPKAEINDTTLSLYAIHCYDNVVVIEKKKTTLPPINLKASSKGVESGDPVINPRVFKTPVATA